MRALGASRTSLVPGGVLAGPWVRNDLWRRARAVPSLDLRFADNKSLTDAVTGASLVTFTRASNGTYTDSAGVLQTAATDVPRFDHNPTTGESLGLLVEEARTNSIRNNTGVGAVAGTPGTLPTNWVQAALGSGLTSQVIGTGSQNGISYIDVRVSGTAGDTNGWALNFDASTQIVASSGQSWTGSLYVAITGGSTAGMSSTFFRIIERTGAGSYVTESNAAWNVATSLFTTSSRLSVVRPLMGATTGFVQFGMYFNTTNGAAIDITLRIGLPQLEQGAFATSVIPTTTAAVTRSADVASITGSAFSGWYRQDEGTLFASGDFVALGSTSFSRIVGLAGANTGIDEISFYTRVAVGVGDGTIYGAVTVNSSLEGDLGAPAGEPNLSSAYRSAIAYKANDFGLSSNGLAPKTDTSGTLPTITQLIIMGSVRFQNRLSGHIRRITYWPQRLPNNILQGITQ